MTKKPLDAIKAEEIDGVIVLYSEKFTKYYATVIALTEEMPEQINNEIRNAFSHLARLHSSASVAKVQREAELAKGHIERACRDCLKSSIIFIHDDIRAHIAHARIRYESVDPMNMSESQAISEARRQLIEDEANGRPNSTDNYERLLERCLTAQQSLNEIYGETRSRLSINTLVFCNWLKLGFKSGIVKSVFFIISLFVADVSNIVSVIKGLL